MSWPRCLYNVLWRLATPWVKRYLKRRARKSPAYLQHWDERFGRAYVPQSQGAIWIHAVSVGETRAVQPLVAALRAAWPDAPLLLTQMTPTGRATARELYPDAEVCYLPYDYPQATRAFLQAYRPRFGVLMETEIWPNLIHSARQQGVPLFLANARLSEKSLAGYRKIRALVAPALAELTAIAAQTAEDAARLRLLGAAQPEVCGNTKYDLEPPAHQLALGKAFKQKLGARPVWVCASTREGEEALLLDAWREAERGDALLVLVPRHPERFDAVAALCAQRGLALQRRSDGLDVAADTQVWLGDSLGELFAYYAAADVAFVGGSLLPFGCHNLIEPASIGLPTLIGPSVFNFKQAAALALQAGAARQLPDAAALTREALRLCRDEGSRAQMGGAARAFSQAHRGASGRMLELLRSHLPE